MKNRCYLLCFLIGLIFSVSAVQAHSGFPVDITCNHIPQPIMVEGKNRLVYELHITNYLSSPVTLTGIRITADNAVKELIYYDSALLVKNCVRVEKLSPSLTDYSDSARIIGGGKTIIVFMDFALDSGVIPGQLFHNYSFSFNDKRGKTVIRSLDGPVVPVLKIQAVIIAPPLKGGRWVAFNAYGATGHRRAMNPMDGSIRIAERYAIDWMQLGNDGALFYSDSSVNANFYSYNATVLAVADGTICETVDTFTENQGSNELSSRTITIDNAVGNHIIIDIGNGHYATYAHLKPGSIKVKAGDKVTTGQAIGLLGNSGNSDAPHLHFQITDGCSPLGAEGIPYLFDVFTLVGSAREDEDILDAGKQWKPKPGMKPALYHKAFPANDDVIKFP